MLLNMYDFLGSIPLKNIRKNGEIILTGSWQYGTATDDSDFDLVLIHDGNLKVDVLQINESSTDSAINTQKTGTMMFNGLEREYDIRFLSYTDFIRKLYRADINCVEYICSPYHYALGNLELFRDVVYTFFKYSLPDPYYRYRLLRSLMGFLNPISRKKSKKFIIPEKVNQNNLIKIANLYFLLVNRYYPLNPASGLQSMRDKDGNTVDLIDCTAPNYNSTEIMLEALERLNKELEEKHPNELKYAQFPGKVYYNEILMKAYE